MTAISTAPPPVQVEENLPCLRCGYNLRTLSPDSRCPECSTPIALSRDPSLLRYADPAWTYGLRVALGLMIFSASIQVAYLLAVLLLLRTQELWMFATLLVKTYQFVAPLFWVGVYLLGLPNPLATCHPRRFSLRRAMRIAAVLNLVWSILLDFKIGPMPVDQLLDLVGTALMFLYLLQIALRSGIPHLIRHTCIAMAVVILTDFLNITIDVFVDSDPDKLSFVMLVFVPVFSYLVFVLHLFRRALRKSAAFARQYWHFCSPLP
jgi:hypothetical protein